MIKLIDFSKHYKKTFLNDSAFSVENINLSVEKGDILGLLGPNGSGKSTIMKAICALHYQTSGKIILTDKNQNEFETSCNTQLINELVGFVPEKSILPLEMYVMDFLEYVARLHNLNGNAKTNAISSVINDCSLEDVLSKKIKTLSKGYSQRLSFAQAIIHKPANLVLDECINGLDPSQIISMRELIKKISKDCAILMSTHLLQEIYSLTNKLCIIKKGRIVAQGIEKDILLQTKCSNLEEAFLKLTTE